MAETGGASSGRPAVAFVNPGARPDDHRVPQSRGPATLLRQLGLRPRKGLSQSFLTDEGVCRKMADDAELGPDDEVLEIGPGLGILTRVLVERAGRVVAVELDPQLATHLPSLVPGGQLAVVQGDALRLDPAQHFVSDYKLVANLPYQITSPVLRRFLVDVRRPRLLVLMVQREMADRVAARAGNASYLSILAQAVADVQLRRTVPPGAFHPRPKVTSAVILLRPRGAPAVRESSLSDFLALVRAGFAQPRKTLANSLAQGLQLPRAAVEARLAAAGIDPVRRPQDLAVDEWVAVFRTAVPETSC